MMNPLVEQACQRINQMKGLYELALSFGEEALRVGAVDYEELADRRHRILSQTRSMWAELAEIEAKLSDATPSERAFLVECHQSLKDLKPKFQEQDRRMHRIFDSILREERKKMSQTNTNLRASRAYLGLGHNQTWH